MGVWEGEREQLNDTITQRERKKERKEIGIRQTVEEGLFILSLYCPLQSLCLPTKTLCIFILSDGELNFDDLE